MAEEVSSGEEAFLVTAVTVLSPFKPKAERIRMKAWCLYFKWRGAMSAPWCHWARSVVCTCTHSHTCMCVTVFLCVMSVLDHRYLDSIPSYCRIGGGITSTEWRVYGSKHKARWCGEYQSGRKIPATCNDEQYKKWVDFAITWTVVTLHGNIWRGWALWGEPQNVEVHSEGLQVYLTWASCGWSSYSKTSMFLWLTETERQRQRERQRETERELRERETGPCRHSSVRTDHGS